MKDRANARHNNISGIKRILLIILLALLIFVLVLRIIAFEQSKYPTEDGLREVEQPAAAETPPPSAAPTKNYGLALPCELDEGKLTITGIQGLDILNPDYNNKVGKLVGAIDITNNSDQHLSSAVIRLTLDTGSAILFEIKDIPAGYSVRAFDTSNTSIPNNAKIMTIGCETSYRDETPVWPENLEFSAEGVKVTMTNISEAAYANVKVYFHTLLDAENLTLYGGKTVSYTVASIYPGESVSFELPDCYLGIPQAVKVVQAS